MGQGAGPRQDLISTRPPALARGAGGRLEINVHIQNKGRKWGVDVPIGTREVTGGPQQHGGIYNGNGRKN